MLNTLPNLDELKQMKLTAYQLYRAEIRRLAHLRHQSSSFLIEQARLGDKSAREQIVLTCQSYAFVKAVLIYLERRPCHIEILDLVGAANLAIVETLDLALSKINPIAYLMTISVLTIKRECIYSAPLIHVPRLANARLKRYPWYEVISLDASVYEENGDLLDTCACPTLLDEEKLTHRFAPLYEAIKKLPRVQRATIIRTYGFFSQPTETSQEVSQTAHTSMHTVRENGRHARKHLYQMLESYLPGMLCPKPEEDTSI